LDLSITTSWKLSGVSTTTFEGAEAIFTLVPEYPSKQGEKTLRKKELDIHNNLLEIVWCKCVSSLPIFMVPISKRIKLL